MRFGRLMVVATLIGALCAAPVASVFLNLFAACYGIARVLFLKDTGLKLQHLDRQLATNDTVLSDLSGRMER